MHDNPIFHQPQSIHSPIRPHHAYGFSQKFSNPITKQPCSILNWQSLNYPSSLEYLATVDELHVNQKVRLFKVITGFESRKKYTIKNNQGQKVFWATEKTDCCTRNICGSKRPFNLKIKDFQKNVVIHIHQPYMYCSCCVEHSMEISSPPDTVIGLVSQTNCTIFRSSFHLKNPTGETILVIVAPMFVVKYCRNVTFIMSTPDGKIIGKIIRKWSWSGIIREMLTDADHFIISFPIDMDIKLKAACLGALFFIDMMFFEKSGNCGGHFKCII